MIRRISCLLKHLFSRIFSLHSDGDRSSQSRADLLPPPAKDAQGAFAEHTVQGCRDRANADLLASVTVVKANRRLALERSAESWTVRANLLGRLNKSFEKRNALDRAHKEYAAMNVPL